MTIPEQAGKVANNAIDAMKSNPSCLAALLVVAVMAVLSYMENERQNARMMERTKGALELLERCYPAQGQGGGH